MDGISITRVVENEGEVPIYAEMSNVPISLEACILNSEDDYKPTYESLKPYNGYHNEDDDNEDEDIGDEEIQNIIMLNEASTSIPKKSVNNKDSVKVLKKDKKVKKKLVNKTTKNVLVKSKKKKLLKTKIGAKKLLKQAALLKKTRVKGDVNVVKSLKKLQVLAKKTEKLEEQSKELEKRKKKQLKELEKETALLTRSITETHEVTMKEKKNLEKKKFQKHSPPHLKVKQKYKKLLSPAKKVEETQKVFVSRSGRLRKINISDDFSANSKDIKFLEQPTEPLTKPKPVETKMDDENSEKLESNSIVKESDVNEKIVNTQLTSSEKRNSSKNKTTDPAALQDVLKESLESWFDEVPDRKKRKKRSEFTVTGESEDFEVKVQEVTGDESVTLESNAEKIDAVDEIPKKQKPILSKVKKLGYVGSKRSYKFNISSKFKNYGEMIDFSSNVEPVLPDKVVEKEVVKTSACSSPVLFNRKKQNAVKKATLTDVKQEEEKETEIPVGKKKKQENIVETEMLPEVKHEVVAPQNKKKTVVARVKKQENLVKNETTTDAKSEIVVPKNKNKSPVVKMKKLEKLAKNETTTDVKCEDVVPQNKKKTVVQKKKQEKLESTDKDKDEPKEKVISVSCKKTKQEKEVEKVELKRESDEKENIVKYDKEVVNRTTRRSSISCVSEVVKKRDTRCSSLPPIEITPTKKCHVILKDVFVAPVNRGSCDSVKVENIPVGQEKAINVGKKKEKRLYNFSKRKDENVVKKEEVEETVESEDALPSSSSTTTTTTTTSQSCEPRKSFREVKHTQKALEMIMIQSDNKRRRRSSEISECGAPSKKKKKRSRLSLDVQLKSPPTSPTRSSLRSSLSGEPFTPTVSIENYLQDKIDKLAKSFDSRWELGDLIWARLTGNPFWPSVVIGEPDNKENFSKVQYKGTHTRLMVHVQFLNDSGQRAWITELYTIPFEGLQELFVFRDNLMKSNQKYYNSIKDSFVPPKQPKREEKWLGATKEAEKLLYKTKDERICYMMIKYPMKSVYTAPGAVADPLSLADSSVVDATTTIKEEPKSVKKRGKKKVSGEMSRETKSGSVAEDDSLKLKLVISTSKSEDTSAVTSGDFSLIQKKKRQRRKKLEKCGDADGGGGGAGTSSDVSGYQTEASRVSSPTTITSTSTVTEATNGKNNKINLFAGATGEYLCLICYDDQKKPLCCKSCYSRYHLSCLGLEEPETEVTTPEVVEPPPVVAVVPTETKKKRGRPVLNKEDKECDDWTCPDCLDKCNPCYVCHEKTGERRKCYVANCGKFYHVKCLKMFFPQTKFNQGAPMKAGGQYVQRSRDLTDDQVYEQLEIVSCPRHVCHTCTSEHVNADRPSVSNEKLVRCIKCPSSFHFGNYCVPAGSEILSTRQIVCGRHYDTELLSKQDRVNISWCFLCSTGGSLLCCDMCPSSFHIECLSLTEAPDRYICEECESGRFPCFGEVVWVKLGRYRWWPCRILFPQEIPLNVWDLPHTQCQFVVKFYGSHDHYWFNRGRVFLYQEGDTDNNTRGSKKLNAIFMKALAEAAEDFVKLKEAREQGLAELNNVNSMKPPHYIKIRTNKFIGDVQPDVAEHQICDCSANDAEPCSSDIDCLNRALLVECNPNSCNAGKRCCNQRFERRLYPPLKAHKTETRGWGLKCQRNLSKGEFVIEYVGEVIDESEYKRRVTRKHETKDDNFYFLTINNNTIIDAGPRGNLARFMNHSCSPNCVTQKWTVNGTTRVGLFAMDDIPSGTELTFDYNLQTLGVEMKECKCGGDRCTGFIGAKVNKVVDPNQQEKTKIRNDLKYTEDYCFICDDGGELMVCDLSNCPKVYHLSCVGLDTWPKEWWYCPRHKCEICNRPTKTFCKLCPTSYCSVHVDRNFMSDLNGGLVCYKHTTQVKEPANRKPPPARKLTPPQNDEPNIDIQVIVVPDVNSVDVSDNIDVKERNASECKAVGDRRKSSTNSKSEVESFMLKCAEEKILESNLNKNSILQIIAGENDAGGAAGGENNKQSNVSRRSKYFKCSSPEKTHNVDKKQPDPIKPPTSACNYDFFHPLQAKYMEAKKTNKT